jgi:hypoxanthine-guanine phosphoribosyltransferase
MVHDKINKIVDELLKVYKGGEEYFDNLDEVIRKEENKDIILELFKGLQYGNVVVSGKFGKHIEQMFLKAEIDVLNLIVINGGLREGNVREVKSYTSSDISNSYFVFIDDSFYKGRTREKINDYLKTYNSQIQQTRVVYDGSIEKDWTVGSYFRYHK